MSRPKMMSTKCTPDFGGKTPMERFERLLKQVVSVPSATIAKSTAANDQHRHKRKANAGTMRSPKKS